jgi:hypothetical protein
MDYVKSLASYQRDLPDLKLRCKAILSISNAFFYNNEYERAAKTAQAISKLLKDKGNIKMVDIAPSERVDLLSKSLMLQGLCTWLNNVPSSKENLEILHQKMLYLEEAESFFKEGLLVLEEQSSSDLSKDKSQFLDRLKQVRETKEQVNSLINKKMAKMVEDDKSLKTSTMSRASIERSFRIKSDIQVSKKGQIKISNSSQKNSPTKIAAYNLSQEKERKGSANHIIVRPPKSKADKESNIGPLFVKPGMPVKRKSARRVSDIDHDAHSIDLQRQDHTEGKSASKQGKKHPNHRRVSSEANEEIERGIDPKSSPQTEKSLKRGDEFDHDQSQEVSTSTKQPHQESGNTSRPSGEGTSHQNRKNSFQSIHGGNGKQNEQIIQIQKKCDQLKKEKEELLKQDQLQQATFQKMFEAFMVQQTQFMNYFQNNQAPRYNQRPPMPVTPQMNSYYQFHQMMPPDYANEIPGIEVYPKTINSLSGGHTHHLQHPQMQSQFEQNSQFYDHLQSYETTQGLDSHLYGGMHHLNVPNKLPSSFQSKPLSNIQLKSKNQIDVLDNPNSTKLDSESQLPQIPKRPQLTFLNDMSKDQSETLGLSPINRNKLSAPPGPVSQQFIPLHNSVIAITPQDQSDESVRKDVQHWQNSKPEEDAPFFIPETHKLTLRNYRNKTKKSRDMMARSIYLCEFGLDLDKIINDFMRLIKNNTHVFSKNVLIDDKFYVIKLQITCLDDQFEAVMCPMLANSSEQDLKDIDEVCFKREHLQKEQFVEMLNMVGLSSSDCCDGQNFPDRFDIHHRYIHGPYRTTRDAYTCPGRRATQEHRAA